MPLEGMDVDQAQRLAQQLDGYAQALIHITGALGTLTEQLSYQWRGPASGTFQQQWSAQYQGALSHAGQALADMHTHLVANIRQQAQASDTDPGGGGSAAGIGIPVAVSGLTLAGLLGGANSAWEAVEKGDGYLSVVESPLDFAEKANESFSQYENSPVIRFLHDDPRVREADTLFAEMPGRDLLDKAGTGMTWAGTGVDAGKAGYDVLNQHYAAAGGQAVDATATLLKGSDDPALMLAGFDISLLHKDYDLASQVNWSQVPNPLDPGVFKSDYVPTFKQLPGEVFSNVVDCL